MFAHSLNFIFDELYRLLGENNILYHAVVGAGIGVGVMITGKILKYFLHTFGRKLMAKTENELDDEILEIILARVIAISGVLALYMGIQELSKGLSESNTNIFLVIEYSNKALYIVAALILTSVIARIVKTLVTYTLNNAADRNESVTHSLTPLVNRLVTFVVFSLATVGVLEHFGQNISTLLTLVGAGSLTLGLAAQDTISNMISGFTIMLDRPFRIGDRVKIPSGEVGDIFEIGLRSTKILDFDNNLIIVPNNELVKTRVVNFGYPGGEVRVVIDLGVAYGSNIEQVKKILISIAKNHPLVLKNPPPDALLTSLGDWALQFRLVCRVASFKDQSSTAENLRVKIYEELMKSGIDIPFPQHVVHLKPADINHAFQTSSKRKKIPR
ncbi:MAG: mechanosensitive ion channel [Bacteroidota bacterium]|nr:mechanosensitive ion channel [Bacteroidota bacterium]